MSEIPLEEPVEEPIEVPIDPAFDQWITEMIRETTDPHFYDLFVYRDYSEPIDWVIPKDEE